MKTILHRASERGDGSGGWLTSRFSFSFADWYEPTRMGFGALRVINDDSIAPLSGFGMHGHKNMEIITIVMKGSVTHEDSMGNRGEVKAGEVQVMTAGTGVVHSERNLSKEDHLELFQIWITPALLGETPLYGQKAFPEGSSLLVSPDGRDGSLSIRQQAYITRVSFESEPDHVYTLKDSAHGVYVFVVEGEVRIGEITLVARDALGVFGVDTLSLHGDSGTTLLLIEVPL